MPNATESRNSLLASKMQKGFFGLHFGWYILLCAIIISLHFGIRLFYFEYTIGSDDQRYIIAARTFASDTRPDLHPVYYARSLWLSTLYAWGQLVGSLTLWTSAYLMVVLSTITALLVLESTRIRYGQVAAILALSIYSFHPLTIQFDTYTIPDNLAVMLLAASIFTFVIHLQYQNRIWPLFLSGLFVGATLAVKSYFVLAALPFGMFLMLGHHLISEKFCRVLTFSTGFVVAAAIGPVLHYLAQGDALAHWYAVSGYGERQALLRAPSVSFNSIARDLVSRIAYVRFLFIDYGFVIGIVHLWTIIFIILRFRSDSLVQVLGAQSLLFFLFLSFMPASISPFLFVEIQSRYLIVVLPILAILGGPALAVVIQALREQRGRYWLASIVFFLIAYNLTIPNRTFDQYKTLEHLGIRQTLSEAAQTDLKSLGVSKNKVTELPDSYYGYNVEIDFLDLEGDLAESDAMSFLKEGRHNRLFLPRKFRELSEKLRIGEDWERVRFGEHWGLIKKLKSRGVSIEPVAVPYTPFRLWLSRQGFETKGQVVGWILSIEYKSVD